ncbi:MAG TPA: hypothetical protein PKE15_00025 [Ottowia sp.]|nr:hypothetical protein [Ottowia sp.]
METTMDDLTTNARLLADARAELGELVQALNAEMESLKLEAMPQIRAAIANAGECWAELEKSIQANPQLFAKPRTVAAHGITFGLEKGKGAIEFADPDKTCALIRKHLAELAPTLIITRESPLKKAVAQLSAADLKRIGATVIDAGDQVVIRPAPSDVDKMVRALVRADLEEGAKE